MKTIKLKYNGKITIYFFYNTILSQVDQIIKDGHVENIVFDFSEVAAIESSVVPNLLILGDYIKSKMKYKPEIYMAETGSAGVLKRYLYRIGFFNLCEEKEYFYLDCDKYTGWPFENEMEKKNTTAYFKEASLEELSEDQAPKYTKLSERIWSEIRKELYPFSSNYLNMYQELPEYNDIDSEMRSNMILTMTHELIKNSLLHGRSYSYVTYQINRMQEKIYLTISDFGEGFYSTLKKRKINVANEGMAIIKGISTRANEQGYGLFDVVCRTLGKSGVVRIHSNNTRIVLSSDAINKYTADDSYLSYLLSRNFGGLTKKLLNHRGYNYVENLIFPGVHVEIVIPIEKNKRNVKCLL